MKVYVPVGTTLIRIDRLETAAIESEFDAELMAFYIDETSGIVNITNTSNGNTWSKDVGNIKNEAGTPIGDSAAVRAYLESIKTSASSGVSNIFSQNNITFTNTTGDYFGTYLSPRTGTLTWDTTGAVRGGVAIVYYQNTTLSIPSTLFTKGVFDNTEINKLYLEYDGAGNVTCNIISDSIISAPTNIVLIEGLDTVKICTVTWDDPSPTTGIDHLEIWRKTGVGGTYAQIGGDISLAAANTYEDTNSGAGLTDSTTYYYQVRAYAADGTTYEAVEGTITISSTSSILLMDTFTGTTIDTAKWNVVNTDPTEISILQNDSLSLTELGTANDNLVAENHIHADTLFSFSTIKVLKFDLTLINQGSRSWFAGFYNGVPTSTVNGNKIGFTAVNGSTTNCNCQVYNGTTSALLQSIAIDLTVTKSLKILVNGTTATFYKWDGSAWVQVATTSANMHTDGRPTFWRMSSSTTGATSAGDKLTIDNLYVTSADFATQNPV